MFKKTVLIVVMLLCSANVWAVHDVSGTRHNLSSTSVNIPMGNQYMAGNEDEVCIFCHTPHGGALNTPLWNRALPTATGFTHYTSASLSPYMKGISGRNVNSESLLCMSCHDGTVSMNVITNSSNRTAAAPNNDIKIMTMFGDPAAVIGDATNIAQPWQTLGASKNLSDDHPISFSYYSAVNDAQNSGKLRPIDGSGNDPSLKGIRFFGAGAVAGGQRVECSSCHDPHVNHEPANGGDASLTPFLVMSNTGSALCLGCHIK